MVNLLIFTGVSGSGKSLSLQYFEEAGYFITDNIPVGAAKAYFDAVANEPKKYQKVALSVNLESAEEIYKLSKNYQEFSVKFIGLTCSKSVLLERYRLTRKLHPDQPLGKTLDACLDDDLQAVKKLRDYFDIFIDSSKLSKNEFRKLIFETILNAKDIFTVSFYSFGYKVSVPQDIETVFDVRLLPNPYWVPELKELTGLDKEVKDYVLNAPQTKEYLKNIILYLDFYLKELKENNRNHASIGIACSGGQHRSVVIAEYLAKHYARKYKTVVFHKDINKK